MPLLISYICDHFVKRFQNVHGGWSAALLLMEHRIGDDDQLWKNITCQLERALGYYKAS